MRLCNSLDQMLKDQKCLSCFTPFQDTDVLGLIHFAEGTGECATSNELCDCKQ